MAQAEGPAGEERRGSPTDRRRYNRRTDPTATTNPPYFEVFERIAIALESIAGTLPRITSSSVDVREPVRPRGATD
jgi:hypothetical protein